jgi:hypothetical protein
MNKTLKTFAIAILVTGATVTATKALATTTTNTQVLENISLALKIYQQGALASTDKSLAAGETAFATSDLIRQLAPFAGFTYDTHKTQKLVLSTVYSNFLVGKPGTILTNWTITNLGASPDVQIVEGGNTTNALSFVTAAETNSYVISNFNVFEINTTGTNLITSILNGLILTNGTVVGTFNTNSILVPNENSLGYWLTIVPTVSATATNVTITQYSPQTNNLFTNANSHVCVLTPKTSSAAASLVEVDHWVSFNQWTDFNGNNFQFYKESGTDLKGNDFSGTNITSQTVYGFGQFTVFTAYPTNGAPAGQTNIIFDWYDSDSALMGFSTGTTKLINLTVDGNSKDKTEFQVIGSQTTGVSGVGYIGGTLTTNNLQTNTFNGVTTTNSTFGSFGNWLGTNYISGLDEQIIYIQDTTDVIAVGTVTISFLSAEPEIVPAQP